MKHLGAFSFNLTNLWYIRASHRYSDGRCALLQWAQWHDGRIAQRGPAGFQLHFVEQYKKTEVPGLCSHAARRRRLACAAPL